MQWITPETLLARQQQAAREETRRKVFPPPLPPQLVETTCWVCGQTIRSPYGRITCGEGCKAFYDWGGKRQERRQRTKRRRLGGSGATVLSKGSSFVA